MSNRKTIIIADNSESFLSYLSLLLRKMGFEVFTARNGLEAINKIRRIRPDLLMLDLSLPILDGLETFGVMGKDSALAGIPVILLTSDPVEREKAECSGLGISGFLNKPVDVRNLHELLQTFIYSPLGFTRRHLRVDCRVEAVVTADGKAQRLHTDTLSEGGAFFRVKNPLPVGTEVDVEMLLGRNESLRLAGTVIYNKKIQEKASETSSGMAVEFRDLSGEKRDRLSEFIRESLTA